MEVPGELISVSRYYGSNPDYVIAGGGNTSYKQGDRLWVKASGVPLAGIDESGFVCLSREKLGKISSATYSSDPSKREKEVRKDLESATLGDKCLRPSVETSLHNLVSFPLVIHTHPAVVNALLCSAKAENETRNIFGDDPLFIEYTDPGYSLFKKTEKEMAAYIKLYGKEPSIILLQNHGMIICGNNISEVKSKSKKLVNDIQSCFSKPLPSLRQLPSTGNTAAMIKEINEYLEKYDLFSVFDNNELTALFANNRESFTRTAHPFTPDNIVYCRYEYLFSAGGAEKVINDIELFKSRYAYMPLIIALEKTGLMSVAKNKGSATRSLLVFRDMMKISFLSENFGGPKFLTPEQIDFVDNWEAENYRRNV
ncbi:MAG: class II aldolase [Bacteroidales bacterium]|nr:class II aldolase [Bacteroidales bacterium]